MISRRKFNLYIGTGFLYFLFGCDSSHQESNNPLNGPIVGPAIDIAGIFFPHPIVKILCFIKLISTIAPQIQYDKDSNTVTFKTNNPRVTGSVNLSSDQNGYCSFVTPFENINFSPAQFLRVNQISYGDENRLNYVCNKLIDDYTQCTDEVLDSGESNHIKMLGLRIQCLENRGHEQINLDYMKVRYEPYKI